MDWSSRKIFFRDLNLADTRFKHIGRKAEDGGQHLEKLVVLTNI